MTLSTSKIVETDGSIDSVVWGSVLLGNGTGAAVLWGDLAVTTFYLTLVKHGGAVNTKVPLNITTDSESRLHIAAVGQDRFAVVADSGASTSPVMLVFDSAGNVIKSEVTFASNTSHYSVAGLPDGSFIVKWADGSDHPNYTRYTQDGIAMSGQTAKPLNTTTTDLDEIPESFAGDSSGGFLYSSEVDTNDASKGSNLKYVSSSGIETLKTTVTAGYRGALASDGTDFWYFYSNTSSNQIYMQKVSLSSGLVGSPVAINGFTSTYIPTAKVLPNGTFLLEDHDVTHAVIVNSAGTVLDSYTADSNTFGVAVPTTDSGALVVENYASNHADPNSQWDIKVSDFDSTYLDPLPATVTTPAPIPFIDTAANDTFTASADTALTVASDTAITGYGIQGGATGGSHVVNGVTYDVSKAGTYGTLYMKSGTGHYTYVPNSAAINALLAAASDSFTVTVDNAATTNGTATLTVNITGVDDKPVIGNLSGSTGQFTAGSSDPVADHANIAPGTTSVTDVDSANFNTGYLQINQSAGGTDGYFVGDANQVRAGTSLATADGRLSPGENLYINLDAWPGHGAAGFVLVGTVAASGGVLHVDFNSSATADHVTWLLKYLTYTAPTTGQRDFTVVLNDGDGGTSTASSFSMTGADATPPSLGSSSPSDNANSVPLSVSPQIVFTEAVKFGAGKIELVDVGSNTVVEQFDVATEQGTADGQVSISGSTLTINPTAALDYSKTYAIRIDGGALTDLAGNAFAGISDTTTFNFTTTATPPSLALAVDTGTSASDGITSNATVNVTLPGNAATWEYSVDGGAHWSTGTGASFTAPVGAYAIGAVQARYVDTAGNQSAAGSNAAAITIDTAAAAPSLALATDTGTSSSDGISRDATVSVTLPADMHSWEYSVDGGAHWTAGSLASFTLAEGSHAAGSVQVRYTDLAGNQSPAESNAASITIDTTAAPPALALASDTGTSGSDGITNIGTVAVTLAADVAGWEYSADAGAHWTTGTGTSFTLVDGNYAAGVVQVRQTDVAGNLSAAAANASAITIAHAAAAPGLALAADTGASASDGITNNGIVNATLPADVASWEYSVDGGAHWTVGTDASFTLAEGSHAAGAVQVRYTDLAGNNSPAASNAATITVDNTIAPPALALAADTGTSGSDGITNNPTINVTLAADMASWEYSVDGGAHWTTGTGTSFNLADGSYAAGTVQVRQTDIADNLSTATAIGSALTIDTAAPAASFAFAADTGISASDGITNNGTVNVTLPADIHSWEYSVDGGAHWTAGDHASFTLVAGTYAVGAVQVHYTDNAGNSSLAASNPTALTIDDTVAAPALALAADNGTSSSDGVTNNAVVNVTLAADVASWEYSVDGGAHWTTGTGTIFTLADGSYSAGTVQVRQTDIADNLSTAAANASALTIDTAAAAPGFAFAADTGTSASDGITNDGTVNVTLPADMHSWEYSVDGGAVWTAGIGTSTSFTLAAGTQAANSVQVRYTDNAGNNSVVASNPTVLTVDHTVAAPALALAADTGTSSSDGLTNNPSVNVTLEADVASWEFSLDGGAHWSAGSAANFTLAGGTYAAGAVQVRQTDIAGNVSASASNASAITVDTAAAAPAFALAGDTGASTSDGITSNPAVNVTLPADSAGWEYSVDAGTHWSAGSGTSFSLAVGSHGSGTVQVRYTDNAGNQSLAASNAAALTIDIDAPAPALALAHDTGSSSTDGRTTDPTINVTLPADVANWEYSADGGAHWSTGHGSSFSLNVGSYAAGAVQARYTDSAGNHSPAAASAAAIVIEAIVSPPQPPVIIDGVPIQTSTVTNPDGSTTQMLSIPVIDATRVDDVGAKDVADIPLATSGGTAVLTAHIPIGYGLQVSGSLTPQGAADALANLQREIKSHTVAGSNEQNALLSDGSGFLGQLPHDAPQLVQSITPTSGPNGPGAATLVINGTPQTAGSPVTALVIDTSKLPGVPNIDLENVDCAVLVGAGHVSGGAGSQTMFGDGASQYIVLGAGNDIVHAGAGDDTVGVGTGNDYIDGGSGNDVVLMPGASRADYSFRFDHGNLVATHRNGGADGVDTIANVETLRFAAATPDLGVEATLRRIYDTTFDRPADAAGAAYWSAVNGHGVSMHDIAAGLLASGEAAGLLGLASNGAFVDQLYRDAFGTQPPAADERAHWVGLLDQGKADRADVLMGIANSTQKLALDAQEHSDIAFAATDAAAVVRLYATLFGRHADEAGANYWIGQSESGMSLHDIASSFLMSGEAQQRYAGDSDNQFVEAMYSVGLGRHANVDEIGYWADKLHIGVLSRADVLLYFADSPEQIGLVGNSTTLPVS